MSDETEKKGRLGKRLLALFLAVFIPLLLAEGAFRIRNRIKYGSAGTSVHEFTTHEESGLRIPIPGRKTDRISIDSRGFRNPELTQPRPTDRIRIAFLGASTTFCAEATHDTATWPHLVVEGLKERFPDADFDYVNAAVAGYVAKSSSTNLAHRVKQLEPDIIVVYHATNDLSKDTRVLAEKAGVWSGAADEQSWLAEYSVLWAWVEKNLTVQARMKAAKSGDNRLTFKPRELSTDFHARLKALLGEARAVAPIVAIATFSHRIRREQSQEERIAASNTSLFYMPYMSTDGLLDGFDEYNRVIREVARETKSILIEDEMSIPADGTHFADSVHLTDAGCVKQAERVVAALAAHDTVRKFVQAVKKK